MAAGEDETYKVIEGNSGEKGSIKETVDKGEIPKSKPTYEGKNMFKGKVIEKRSWKDITFREEIYPRKKADENTVQLYCDSTGEFPPVEINQDNILLNVRHRQLRDERHGIKETPVVVWVTKSDHDAKRLAFELNNRNGVQYSEADFRNFAMKYIEEFPPIEFEKGKEEIIHITGMKPDTVRKWLSPKRRELKERRDRMIIELSNESMKSEEIAERVSTEIMETHVKTVNRILRIHGQNGTDAKMSNMDGEHLDINEIDEKLRDFISRVRIEPTSPIFKGKVMQEMNDLTWDDIEKSIDRIILGYWTDILNGLTELKKISSKLKRKKSEWKQCKTATEMKKGIDNLKNILSKLQTGTGD